MSEISSYPASLIRRGLAFIIDCVISTLPIILISLLLLQEVPLAPLVLSPVPAVGIATIYELPVQVDEALSHADNGDGTTYDLGKNLSFSATCIRIFSVLALAFYILYTTLCTYLYDKTVGKKLFGIEVKHLGNTKPIIWNILRETLGKVILNTTIVVPIVSIFMILFTPEHRGVHDFIGKTMVVESI